jgi:2-polyprenyl-6-hydroxyphenyl methylase/3-demethylubiquinone-9 3-methyltransferase
LAVFATAGRAPAGSSCGSTRRRSPAAWIRRVAWRRNHSRIRAKATLAILRAFHDSQWAAAPDDPEPWAWERRRALLLGEAHPGERVLDLGCGAGRFVAALRDAGADPVGVEIAPAALERARRNAPGADLRLLEPDGSLPLEHRSIDLVWCSEVLEHVADVSHLLFEARRVLRPGGRLLATVPFHGRVQGALVALTRFDAHFDPLGEHLRFFTRGSLTATLDNAGFEALDVRPWGGPPLLRRSLVARAVRP